MEEKGRGSVAWQKAVMPHYVDGWKDDLFDDSAEVLLERLSKAAEAIGAAIDTALSALAEMQATQFRNADRFHARSKRTCPSFGKVLETNSGALRKHRDSH